MVKGGLGHNRKLFPLHHCGDNSVQVIIHMIGCAELGADYPFPGSEFVNLYGGCYVIARNTLREAFQKKL